MKATLIYNDDDTNPTTVEVDVLAISTGETGDRYITITEDGWNTDAIVAALSYSTQCNGVEAVEFLDTPSEILHGIISDPDERAKVFGR